MEENRVSGGFYHKFINYVMNPVVRGIKRITMGRNLEHTLSRRDSTGINIEQAENGVDQNSSHVVLGLGSSTPSPPVLKKGSAIVGGRQTQVQKGANTPHSSSKRIGGWFF